MAVLGRARSVSRPAHQTGRADFQHPAFRPASPYDPRRATRALHRLSLICWLAGRRSCSKRCPTLVGYIQSGKLRALGVSTATRSPVLPDIPTVGEFVPGYKSSVWFGIAARRQTPADIIELLNKEINAGLADPVPQCAA